MSRKHWHDRRDRLYALYDLYDDLPTQPVDIRGHWVRYLVVVSSGFIETTVRDIFSDYAESKSAPRVSRYVTHALERPGNMTSDKLSKLVRTFDPDWWDDFDTSKESDAIKSSLNSIVNNRNLIAHGENISLTIGQLRSYFDQCLVLIDLLFKKCLEDTYDKGYSRKNRRRKSRG